MSLKRTWARQVLRELEKENQVLHLAKGMWAHAKVADRVSEVQSNLEVNLKCQEYCRLILEVNDEDQGTQP